MDGHIAFRVDDSSHPGEVRRQAVMLVGRLGFSAADTGRVALAATEAATNIVKHAGRGVILLRSATEIADRPSLELLALDQGPGMADVDRCMQDGFSSAGSPGTGLGALSRLASLLEIYSQPGHGTALLVHVLPHGAKLRPAVSPFVVGAISIAFPGEEVCGDGWAFLPLGSGARFILADGLGHGQLAALAAQEAIRMFEANASEPLTEVFQAMHGALLATRGAAVSVAEVSPGQAEIRFAAVGNVSGFLGWPGGSRRMVGRNGTVGAQHVAARVTPYPWQSRAALVMHSDGLNSHTALDGYPGLIGHHPTLIAGVLYRDFTRGNDDATVLVASERMATA